MNLSGSSDLAGRPLTGAVGGRSFRGKKRTWGKKLAKEAAGLLLMSVDSVGCAMFIQCTHAMPWVEGSGVGAGEKRLGNGENLEEGDDFVIVLYSETKFQATGQCQEADVFIREDHIDPELTLKSIKA